MESRLPFSFAFALFGFILSIGVVTLSLTGGDAWQQVQVDSPSGGDVSHGWISEVFPPPIYMLEACI